MGTGFFILWNKVSPPDPQIELEEEKVTLLDKDVSRPLHKLDTFLVNLSDRGVTRYLKTTIVLELTSEDAVDEINERLSQIRNVILMIMPAKTSKDIRTVEGKRALSGDITSELNSLLKNGSVTNLFFTEFVIQ